MSSPYWHVGKLSSFLGIDPKTAYAWLRDGLIPGAFKIGGRWFIDHATLRSRLKEMASRPTKSGRPVHLKDDRHDLLA